VCVCVCGGGGVMVSQESLRPASPFGRALAHSGAAGTGHQHCPCIVSGTARTTAWQRSLLMLPAARLDVPPCPQSVPLAVEVLPRSAVSEAPTLLLEAVQLASELPSQAPRALPTPPLAVVPSPAVLPRPRCRGRPIPHPQLASRAQGGTGRVDEPRAGCYATCHHLAHVRTRGRARGPLAHVYHQAAPVHVRGTSAL
jgi:hypothetical protein